MYNLENEIGFASLIGFSSSIPFSIEQMNRMQFVQMFFFRFHFEFNVCPISYYIVAMKRKMFIQRIT